MLSISDDTRTVDEGFQHRNTQIGSEEHFFVALQSFLDARPEQIQEVVQTNLVGCLLCTRAAIRIMAAQPRGGHIFNMDGAGADGLPSPQYAAYGATKAGEMSSPSRRARWAMRCHNN